MTKLKIYLIPVILFIGVMKGTLHAQESASIPANEVRQIAESFIANSEENRLKYLKETQKRLRIIRDKEQKIKEQLSPDVLGKSEDLTLELHRKMEELEGVIKHPDSLLKSLPVGPYIARFDSLSSLFTYATNRVNNIPIMAEAQQEIINLKKQLLYAGMLQEWLKERQMEWMRLGSLNSNINSLKFNFFIKEWQDEFNVYKQQLDYWKENLKDSRKMEREVLNLLNKLPAFRDFLSKNSELARLFGPVPGGGNTPPGQPLPGLQSIQSISQELELRFGQEMIQGGGFIQQQMQTGMDQLGQDQNASIPEMILPEGLPSPGGRGVGGEVLSPSQAEQTQLKAKPIGKRFEVGWNLQSAMRIQNFPATRDIGLSVGYKLNPRSVIGGGIAYKFALGESWKNIKWTHEGLGLRSYLDWRPTEAGSKLFKGIWLTGGFELNYWNRIARNSQIKDLAWQKAGIIGVTKIIPGKKRNGKLQILFNFLNTNLPLEDRISIRWGKTF